MEKKIWSLFGGIALVSFLVSGPGQNIIKNFGDAPAAQVNK